MQYSRLGETGLVVSRLAFGTMTFTHTPGTGRMPAVSKVDQAGANDIVAAALDGGINFFNGADVYANGDSEEILGQALGKRRSDAIIATKVGGRRVDDLLSTGLSRRHIIKTCEESLRRLGTDWIDVYLFHKTDPHTPLEETLDALEQLVRDGKVRYTGVSNWEAWRVAKAVQIQKDRGYSAFAAAEYYYSLIGREIESDLIPLALDSGMSVTPWSPLASGFLSGKYSGADPSGGGGRRAAFSFPQIDADLGDRVIGTLNDIARSHDASCAQIALAWLLSKPAVGSVIISATTTAQLADNIASADVRLTDEEIGRLDALAPPPVSLLQSVMNNQVDQPIGTALAAATNR